MSWDMWLFFNCFLIQILMTIFTSVYFHLHTPVYFKFRSVDWYLLGHGDRIAPLLNHKLPWQFWIIHDNWTLILRILLLFNLFLSFNIILTLFADGPELRFRQTIRRYFKRYDTISNFFLTLMFIDGRKFRLSLSKCYLTIE